MSRNLLTLSLAATFTSGAAFADVPNVAVDIAPVHSLVTRVMQGVGTPNLIMQQGASPHHYSLRPSDAQTLQDADLVFWVSAGLSPWLKDGIETLAGDAVATELAESAGTIELSKRNDALFEKHNHDDHDDHAEEGHDDHEDHAEKGHDDDHEGHAEEGHAEEGHDDHDNHAHAKNDPHAWLSPENAMNWMNVIAGQLSAADPENAGAYFANAAAGRAELEAVIAEANGILEPARGTNFIVFHDAYQYFENDFDFPAAGAISIGDASDPSPARVAEIQARVKQEDINCVLSEPQFNPAMVATVMDGTDTKTSVIDPLASDLELGSALYPQFIRNLATSIAACK